MTAGDRRCLRAAAAHPGGNVVGVNADARLRTRLLAGGWIRPPRKREVLADSIDTARVSAYKGIMTNANRPALVLSTDLPHARARSRASCACGMGLHSTERAVANWARVHKIMYPTCSPTMTRQTWQGGTLVPTTVSV